MESCEFYNHDECPVVYVNGLLEKKDEEIALTEKALELAVEELDDAKDMLRECGKKEWAGLLNTSVDYFKAKSKEIVDNDTSI